MQELRYTYYPCNIAGKFARALHLSGMSDSTSSATISARTPLYNYTMKQYEAPSANDNEAILCFPPGSTAAMHLDDPTMRRLIAFSNDASYFAGLIVACCALGDEARTAGLQRAHTAVIIA